MIAVIFEVIPNEDGMAAYLELAKSLKRFLDKIDGFLSVERFQSLSNPEKILSLSFWENEEALKQWRDNFEHQIAQQKGKESLFCNYRIRVGAIIRDYGCRHDQG